MRDGLEGRLFAQRGFDGWEELLSREDIQFPVASADGLGRSKPLLMTPRAAAPIVTALVQSFHLAGSAPIEGVGSGWELADDPARPDALSGGTFDDAGFPATRRVLAQGGVWVGPVAGPGTMRRSAFRDPPAENVTNLVMDGGEITASLGAVLVVKRSRVIRSSQELWVLELDVASRENPAELERIWIRTEPRLLLLGCASRLGGSQVTPDGPTVPALLFEGIGVPASR
jgi:hypothetical protein